MNDVTDGAKVDPHPSHSQFLELLRVNAETSLNCYFPHYLIN